MGKDKRLQQGIERSIGYATRQFQQSIEAALEIDRLILSLRALKHWSEEKAYYAATVSVIKKKRNLRQIVQALAIGETYRNALKAGATAALALSPDSPRSTTASEAAAVREAES